MFYGLLRSIIDVQPNSFLQFQGLVSNQFFTANYLNISIAISETSFMSFKIMQKRIMNYYSNDNVSHQVFILQFKARKSIQVWKPCMNKFFYSNY